SLGPRRRPGLLHREHAPRALRPAQHARARGEARCGPHPGERARSGHVHPPLDPHHPPGDEVLMDASNAPSATPAPTGPIRVFVVEDQAKILKHQLKLLEASSELELVGTAMSGEAALEELETCTPDVILLDLGLPRMDGIAVTRAVKARYPSIEILIF